MAFGRVTFWSASSPSRYCVAAVLPAVVRQMDVTPVVHAVGRAGGVLLLPAGAARGVVQDGVTSLGEVDVVPVPGGRARALRRGRLVALLVAAPAVHDHDRRQRLVLVGVRRQGHVNVERRVVEAGHAVGERVGGAEENPKKGPYPTGVAARRLTPLLTPPAISVPRAGRSRRSNPLRGEHGVPRWQTRLE
jgi:hypothetical protein